MVYTREERAGGGPVVGDSCVSICGSGGGLRWESCDSWGSGEADLRERSIMAAALECHLRTHTLRHTPAGLREAQATPSDWPARDTAYFVYTAARDL